MSVGKSLQKPDLRDGHFRVILPEQYISRKQTLRVGGVSASSTLVPLIVWTHLDFFATPLYIDITATQYLLTVGGLVES